MITSVLVLLALIALGALMFSQIKPENVTLREMGRAIMWAGLFALVWLLAQQVPPRLR